MPTPGEAWRAGGRPRQHVFGWRAYLVGHPYPKECRHRAVLGRLPAVVAAGVVRHRLRHVGLELGTALLEVDRVRSGFDPRGPQGRPDAGAVGGSACRAPQAALRRDQAQHAGRGLPRLRSRGRHPNRKPYHPRRPRPRHPGEDFGRHRPELLGGRGRLRGDPVLLVNPRVGREAILRVAPAEHSNPDRGRSARLAGRRAATPDLQETGYRRRGNTGRFGPMGRTLLRLSNCQEGRRARPNPGRVGRARLGVDLERGEELLPHARGGAGGSPRGPRAPRHFQDHFAGLRQDPPQLLHVRSPRRHVLRRPLPDADRGPLLVHHRQRQPLHRAERTAQPANRLSVGRCRGGRRHLYLPERWTSEAGGQRPGPGNP